MSTLKEIINTTEGNYNVKIGTKGGSGFLWCGHISKLRDNFADAEKRVTDIYKKRLQKARSHMNGMFKEYPNVGRYARDKYRYTNAFGSFEDYIESLKQYFIDLDKARVRVEKAEQRLAELVPLGDREVIETYRSITEDNMAIIIVEGNETGPAWDLEEFNALEEKENGEIGIADEDEDGETED